MHLVTISIMIWRRHIKFIFPFSCVITSYLPSCQSLLFRIIRTSLLSSIHHLFYTWAIDFIFICKLTPRFCRQPPSLSILLPNPNANSCHIKIYHLHAYINHRSTTIHRTEELTYRDTAWGRFRDYLRILFPLRIIFTVSYQSGASWRWMRKRVFVSSRKWGADQELDGNLNHEGSHLEGTILLHLHHKEHIAIDGSDCNINHHQTLWMSVVCCCFFL